MSTNPEQELAKTIRGDGITTREQAGVAARAAVAAGWVSPEEVAARVAAARREAWEEGARRGHALYETPFILVLDESPYRSGEAE